MFKSGIYIVRIRFFEIRMRGVFFGPVEVSCEFKYFRYRWVAALFCHAVNSAPSGSLTYLSADIY